jgi:hypothetical protein
MLATVALCGVAVQWMTMCFISLIAAKVILFTKQKSPQYFYGRFCGRGEPPP